MLWAEIFLLGLALSMDAFAVALCKGLNMNGKSLKPAFVIALFFGFFQGFMPLLGWLLGQQFESIIAPIDHWLAFILLGLIGVNMIREGIQSTPHANCSYKTDYRELFLLSIATSIDALVVGITLAFLQVSIVFSVLTIAVITFFMSLLGVIIGKRFGLHQKNYAEIFGGIILIFIGLRILVEHLAII
jgi:putative Mn2+ efflux pump MntP